MIATDQPQRGTRLVLTSAGPHSAACGERVPCPFGGDHGLGVYRPAERQVRPLATIVTCHICQRSWREVSA